MNQDPKTAATTKSKVIYEASAKSVETPPSPRINVSAKQTTRLLLLMMLALLFFHFVSIWMTGYQVGTRSLIFQMDRYFNLNNESNFPTFFSAVILLLASLLLFVISRLTGKQDKDRRTWAVLSFLFVFMAVDEATEIHEQISPYMRRLLKTDLAGFLSWAWVLPYLLLAVAVGVYCFGFLQRLPKPTRINFLTSGLLFVFGAAGIEAIEGRLVRMMPGNDLLVVITTTTQEILEIGAIILFIYGLLSYIATRFPQLQWNTRKN